MAVTAFVCGRSISVPATCDGDTTWSGGLPPSLALPCWCLDAVKRFGVGVLWLNGLAWGSVQFARGHPAQFEQRVTLHVVQTARGGLALIGHSPINMFKLRGMALRELNTPPSQTEHAHAKPFNRV